MVLGSSWWTNVGWVYLISRIFSLTESIGPFTGFLGALSRKNSYSMNRAIMITDIKYQTTMKV